MAGNIASADDLRHGCGCSPARPDDPVGASEKSQPIQQLERCWRDRMRTAGQRPLFRQFDDIVKLEHGDHLRRRCK
jgi:hypothetical protein